MNIKFDIYNWKKDADEIIQFNNIKDLNSGFWELFNHCLGSEYGIKAYCDDMGITDEEGIGYENLENYDFINHEDYNFIMDGVKYSFLINEYEIY